ncbi:hypothetical protein ACP4OV_026389 [Aristida adscensionis]
MEAVENASVEGGILWLVQTILDSLLPGKLLEWLDRVGLAEGIERLKTEIERVETVVAAAKGRANGNKPLARSLARIRELLYDADDVVDELDYFRLHEQAEGGTGTSSCANEPQGMQHGDGSGAEQSDGSRDDPELPSSRPQRKNMCKEWVHFEPIRVEGKIQQAQCKYCKHPVQCGGTNGTNGMRKHLRSKKCLTKRRANEQPPNPTGATDAAPNATTDATRDSVGRKRMRSNEAAARSMAPNTNPWNKAEFSLRVDQITLELQRFREDVTDFLKDSIASSDQYWSSISDTRLRTSSLVPPKVYGRDEVKDDIIRAITVYEPDAVTVLPIVGIAGVGKTVVAQLVYNDPIVESHFERIWVWVGDKFDEVALASEMSHFLSQETNVRSPGNLERTRSLAELQEIPKAHMQQQHRLKRFMLVLDDVWESMKDYRWRKLLVPLQSSHAKGTVILLTTRNMSVAERLGTVEPIKLDALKSDIFWVLFKAFVFGDEELEGYPNLNGIGLQIAKNLKGNPLAAETAGNILRKNLTVEHWSNILNNEDWKSLEISGGIMSALKLSYDQLDYHLQQCLLYCSIYPNNYKFLAKDLVHIWISLGFVRCNDPSSTLDKTGREYITDLVNLGFFQKVVETEHTPVNQTQYVICGIMHDFGSLVSRTMFASMDDGSEFSELPPTIRYLSIVTGSAYWRDQCGNIFCNDKFEKNLQRAAKLVTKLRTLVLIGNYGTPSFQTFQDLLRKACNLRLLQITAENHELYTFQCSLVSPMHLRYLKLEFNKCSNDFPQALSKWYHIQVLDLGIGSTTSITTPNGMYKWDNLFSIRHLAAPKSLYSGSIGKMTSLQEFQCVGSEITQLQFMSELIQLRVCQLGNVTSRDEAYGARLINKKHLEFLHFSWKDTSPQIEYVSDTYSPTNEHSIDTEKEVLEGLEPYHNLKHLRISGYKGATSPAWLAASVTCLQTLHLEDCREWQTIPSLQRLPFLTKLKLRDMCKVIQVSISSSLEELVLIEMPKLQICSCNSVRDLNTSLRVLKIERCEVLENFTLFESCEKLKIDHRSWLPCLKELTVHECPNLKISNPLPPSSNNCTLSISRVSRLPRMKRSSNGKYEIQGQHVVGEYSDGLMELNGRILSFHNLRAITELQIRYCQNLLSISLEGFRQLISLKSLEIELCQSLFSPDFVPEHIHGDMTAENFSAFPSLKNLSICLCGITGKWLSVVLRHAPALEEFYLAGCDQISGLLIEGGPPQEISSRNPTSAPHASFPVNPDRPLRSSTQDEFLCIPLDLVRSLRKIYIHSCLRLKIQTSKEGFSGFTSLEELTILDCPDLMASLVHNDINYDGANGTWLLPRSLVELEINYSPETLQPCFPDGPTALKKLDVWGSPDLKSLQLHTCITLEELNISNCKSLEALQGLQSLCSLRSLEVDECSGLTSLHLSSCTALEELRIGSCGSLKAVEGFEFLGCLRSLELTSCNTLESLPLHSCAALEGLVIIGCESLRALEGLDSLGRLRNLSDLSWQVDELCPQLETLKIDDESFLTESFCKHLTSLQRLEVCYLTGLTGEQESALQLLTSLQELRFVCCEGLTDLPVGLHSLPSLKRLEIYRCPHISRLPKDLPPSLEELVVRGCSDNLKEQCITRATTKLTVTALSAPF